MSHRGGDPRQVAFGDRAHRGGKQIRFLLIGQSEAADRVAGLRIVPLAQRAGDLQADLRVFVADQLRDLRAQLGGRLEQTFAQPHGIAADARVFVVQGRLEERGRQPAQAVERAERLQPRLGPRVFACHLRERGDDRFVAALDEHELHQIALPAARAVERVDQFARRHLGEIRPGARRLIFGHDAIDAAHVVSGAGIDAGQPIGRDPFRVLDDHAIHVDDPQRAVGTVLDVDRPRPVVGRRIKLRVQLARRAEAGKRGPQRFENPPRQQVVHRLAHEGVAPILLAEQVVPIDQRAARRRDAVRAFRMVETPERAADRIEVVRIFLRHHHDGFRRRDERVAADVAILQRRVEQQLAVLVGKIVAPVVAGTSLLRAAAALQLEQVTIGIHAEVADAQLHFQTRFVGAMNRAAEQPVGSMNPVVEPVAQAVHAGLPVAGIEAGEDHFADVGLAVAVGVLGVNDVGRRADQHPLLPHGDAVGKVDVVEKDGRLVELAVAVRAFEQPHAPSWLIVPFDAVRIVVHLGHPELAVRPKIDGHGRRDQRLGRDQFDLQPLGHANRLERLLGRQRRREIITRSGR